MTETYFIGDTHFGHKSIIKFESEARPFPDLETMHETMIANWNKVVRKGDKVIHLGDFCFGERWLPIAGRLNGLKYLVLGNHDCLSTAKYLKYFHKAVGAMEFDGNILTHIPVHPSQFPRYKYNIHGHLHSKLVMQDGWPQDSDVYDLRYINVSCERTNLTPVSYAQLKHWRMEND